MPRPLGRRVAAGILALAVLAAHLWLAERLVGTRLGAPETAMSRIDVAFVQVLEPAAPPPPPAAPKPRVAAATSPAASAPAPLQPIAPPQPLEPLEPLELPSVPELGLASLPPAIVGDLQLGPAEPGFDWPPSTRLRYVLTGHYRGPVDGHARVEWLRDGERYQVHLDVVIGTDFAPLITRQMSSEGRLTALGLSPQRYLERTRILLRDPQFATIRFEGEEVGLPGGRRVPRPPGVQDAVSQFVQLSWHFYLEPALLTTGRVIELPLALPRQVRTWVFDVQPAETLWTPVGAIEAVRLRPRRVAQRGGDLVAETWFAPSLQYLPVRILIRQDEDTFVDLLIDELPLQAAPAQPPSKRRP